MQQRKLIYDCLKAVMMEKQYANLTLRHALKQLPSERRGYVTQVVYGTLENYRFVRWCWECFVERLPKKRVCVLLDMAVYELLWLKEAPYALINESVNFAKRYLSGNAKLVNAVLRKVAAQGKRALPNDRDEALGIETSHPLWLIKMWNAQYGTDVCEKICRASLHAHKGFGRVNTLKISRSKLLAQEPLFREGTLGEDSFVMAQGNISDTKWYRDGYVAIQDEASQLIAPFLAPQPKERILDACSAPGTKACHMAQLMKNQGEIISVDVHEHRVKLIEEGAARLGITCIKAMLGDACELSQFEDESFDRILCDVPCSGYGTFSHKSDIKVHMESSDMDSLIPIQAAILRRAAQLVKRGGVIVYSTCTLNKKENEKQVATFLKEHSEFVLVEERPIFPHEYGCDGFYMAKLEKMKENL